MVFFEDLNTSKILFHFAFLTASVSHAALTPITWEQGFEEALKTSELIASQAEFVQQADERYSQAKGAILPTVNFLASYTRQEDPQLELGRSFAPSAQPSVRFNAVQPIFRGFREFAGIKQTRLLVDASQATLDQTRTALFVEFITNYLSIASLEKELENLDGELKLYDERIRELQGRVRIGRSRTSEVLTIEASRATALAQKELTRSQMLSLREQFSFLTGLPMETQFAAEPQPFAGVPANIQTYLEAIESRPDIRSLRVQNDAFDAAVDVAWGAHLPSIDLSGNYWLKRVGANQKVSWDVQASLSFPIFAGGTIQSRVREVASQSKQGVLGLERTRRLATQEIRSLYQVIRTDQEQIKALNVAKDASEKNYRQQKRDYQLGLVTNLDVLQALSSSQASKRALDRALYTAQLNRLKLEAASAIRPSFRAAP